MKTIYLAGPMRGIAQFNFPAFMEATARLRSEGHRVFSPAENDQDKLGDDFGVDNATGDIGEATKEEGFSLRDALKDDLSWICDNATHIALLPGWENSNGSKAEWSLAVALDLGIIYL